MADVQTSPAKTSSAYGRMEQDWCRIDDILAGAQRIREKRGKYLPKYEAEDDKEYARRLKASPWRPEFEDSLRALIARPFSKDVALSANASQDMKDLAEDIDGCGNNITAFARETFRGGVSKGLHAILVDYPQMAAGATLADERAAGARPYWINIRANDILALYTAFQSGKEIITHVRIKEETTSIDGFDEVCTEAVRVFDRKPIFDEKNNITGWAAPTWEVWQKSENGYEKKDFGTISLPVIPLVLFWTGEREGSHYVKPPLNDLADMQIELYRALSRHEETLTYAGSPMLQGKGIAPPQKAGDLKVGPKTVLFAPPGVDGATTEWAYLAPDAATLTAGAAHVESIQNDMRRVGMEPMVARNGTVSATGDAITSAKAHSVLQAWAMGLKDALEQAFVFTAQWMKQTTTPEVSVFTDFVAVPFAQPPLDALKDANSRGKIDDQTYLEGLRRFGVLQPDADIQEIMQKAADQNPSDPTREDLLLAHGIDPNAPPAPAKPAPGAPAQGAQ